MSLENLVFNTSSTNSRKKRITVLKETMPSVLAPLKNCSETDVEVSLKPGKIRGGFPKLVWYCRTIPKAKDMSSIRNEVDRYHPCVRRAIRFEDVVQGKKSPDCFFWPLLKREKSVKFRKDCRDGKKKW